MTDTIVDVLDKQMVIPSSPHQAKKPSTMKDQKEKIQEEKPQVSTQKEDFPDLFLPIRENYRISDWFCGYPDSLSADNNQMVLVELNNLSYRYGTSIYAVDGVNGTMYGKFSMGYRLIPERATVKPQYPHTSTETEYTQAYENTLPGITNIPTPIAKSTPVTQALHIPITRTGTQRDIMQPVSSEEARAIYLENQMKGMSDVKVPKISVMEKETSTSTDLTRRIDTFCREQKEKRRKERESHKQILIALEQSKSKQPSKEEGEIVYSQLAHDMEKTRDVVWRSMSQASTISVEEQHMALTEKDFTMIRKKMDKIDQCLHDMYKNWQAEYRSANTVKECEEIRNFYKPYLDKYESKYRILYQLLQQPSTTPTPDEASGITPSLAALCDATSLKQREWIRSEPVEDNPRQYTSIGGHLTPHTPKSEDMRLEHTLDITPEGSLNDIPNVVRREPLDMSSETTYMEFPNTQMETTPKESTTPKSLPRTKEASRAEVLASTRQFFAAIDQRNMNVSTENQVASVEVHDRDEVEVSEIPTTTVVTTTTTTTSPLPADMALIGTSSPRVSLPEGSSSCPTVTVTCRPRTWMQQLTEGQISEPRAEDNGSEETSVVESLPEEIPDELGHEWRVLHPFDLPGVRFPNDTTPLNQRHLAEYDALVELIQTTKYLDEVPTWGQRDYHLYPPWY